MTDDGTKRRLRRQARAARGTRTGAGRDWTTSLRALPQLRSARTVAAYTAYGDEPSLEPLLHALLDDGVRLLLPVLRADHDLDWVEVRDATQLPDDVLRAGDPHRSVTPAAPHLVGEAAVVVVPALLVGLDGARLGQGGGSYDRALTRVRPGTPVVAVVHEDEVVAAGVVPVDEHDQRVTHAATPTRLIDLAAPPGR